MKKPIQRFSLIFLITALAIVGGFEISVFQAEKLFWINLGL